jgi:acetolactate synthase-1/2/3 large subunit
MFQEVIKIGGPDHRTSFNNLAHVKALIDQKEQLETEAGKQIDADGKPLHPTAVNAAIKKVFPIDTVLATDIGALVQPQTVYPFLKVTAPRTCITPTSFMTMGFSANCLPVAKLVYPDRPAVSIVGDGSFQMIMNILPVAVQYHLPVTWCVMNDQGFGSIADVQDALYSSRYKEVNFEVQPDFAMIAEACQCYGERVEEPDQIEGALSRALEANQKGIPAVLDFIVARERSKMALEYFGGVLE